MSSEKPNHLDEKAELRRYLLGRVGSEAEREAIEERLIVEDGYSEELAFQEEELIDSYLDGQLSDEDRRLFEDNFLISNERRQKLQFARAFASRLKKEKKREVKEPGKSRFWQFLTLYLSPVPVVAISIGILLAGLGVWYYSANQGNEGLVALNRAYKSARPVQSHVTGFDYAPFLSVRGEEQPGIDADERARAEFLLRNDASKNQSAESLHSLGRLYIAKRQFDQAISELERARQLDLKDPEILNDLGAAYFEKGNRAGEGDAQKLEFSSKALEFFQEAIELNPKLPAPRFNKALCLQELNLRNRAQDAWNEYLSVDPNSKWADEARRNLESLNGENGEISPEELEHEFVAAMQNGDDDKAFSIYSQNRELIREKYLPQRFAISYIFDGNGSTDELKALDYLGRLDQARTGDLFASKLSVYYKELSDVQRRFLITAHAAMQSGYQYCLKGEFSSALNEFGKAKSLFNEAGDHIESLVAEHFVAYCVYNTNRLDAAITIWTQNMERCQGEGLKWLSMSDLYWIAFAQNAKGSYLESKGNFKKAIVAAEEERDSYFLQRINLALAEQNHFFGENREALSYLAKVLSSSRDVPSMRQKWRNYKEVKDILSSLEYYAAAKAVAEENIDLADDLADPIFIVSSRIEAGSLSLRSNDLSRSRFYLMDAQKELSTIAEASARDFLSAQICLQLGTLERRSLNYSRSLELFDQAIEIDSKMQGKPFTYQAEKGKLLVYVDSNNQDRVEEQIELTVELAERFRRQILEERWRDSFFDSEQTIYDIAAEYEFDKHNYEKSYNYAETSSSRSLLDWLEKGGAVTKKEEGDVEVLLKDVTEPLSLSEIRQRMPEAVQILQFSVLEKRVLIWLVSRERFTVVASDIGGDELRDRVREYVDSLLERSEKEQEKASDLYSLLIKPVEVHLESDKTVCIIPSKALFRLPFAALRSDEGRPFLTQYKMIYAPSANVFLLSTMKAARKDVSSDESILSIGNPAFDTETFDDIPYLPAAELESKQVANLYPKSRVLIGRNSTVNSFETLAPQFDVIHFAGHYLARRSSPWFSGMLLAKDQNAGESGLLKNSDLLELRLSNAKLVVLSACDTGVEGYYGGEGLIGLSRIFLSIGVPVVVGSQWEVDSDATAALMMSFHRARRSGHLSVPDALREAQLEMISSPDNRFRDPYYWAAFATFGAYTTY